MISLEIKHPTVLHLKALNSGLEPLSRREHGSTFSNQNSHLKIPILHRTEAIECKHLHRAVYVHFLKMQFNLLANS